MQQTLYQTADAGHSVRQRMQESLYQTDAGDSIRQRMQETLYQTADAGDSLSDQTADAVAGVDSQSADQERQRMQETDAGDSIRQQDAGRLSSDRQTLYQTADAGDSAGDSIRQLSDSGCRSLSSLFSIRQRMQQTLYQTSDAGNSLSDSGCRRLSIIQWISLSDSGCSGCRSTYKTADLSLYQTAEEEYLHQTADAGVSIRQWLQETLYQTADAGVSQSDSGCKSISIRQRMQYSLYQTADAGDTQSDSGCRSLPIRQRMQEYLHQQRMQ